MKLKNSRFFLLGLALMLTLSISARSDGDHHDDSQNNDGDHHDQDCRDSDHHEDNKNSPVKLIGIIPIPGNPIVSADISWTDPGTERYYFGDASNAGVDIIDASDDVWVGRVTGFAGVLTNGGGTSTTNGSGPSGVLVTPSRKLWAADGNSTVKVADADPNSSTYLNILAAVSTAWNNPNIAADTCDGGTSTTHYCGKTDELSYDSKDHIIMVTNNGPLSLTATGTPPAHAKIDPYATFISADPPYTVLGHVSFVGAGGVEQSLWDEDKQRFLISVPGKGTALGSIQVFNPPLTATTTPVTPEATYPIDCSTIPGVASPTAVNNSGIALGPFGHILVSACGSPVVLTLKAKPTPHINVIGTTNVIGGGDEVWYNPGDGRFYVTALVPPVVPVTVPPTPQVQNLGVIDAETGTLLQVVSQFGLRGKNPAAFSENNHVFGIQSINAGIVAKTSPDDSVCAHYGFTGTGCIAVFEHTEPGEVNAQ